MTFLRHLPVVSASLLIFFTASCTTAHKHEPAAHGSHEPVPASTAWAKLKAGNARFSSASVTDGKPVAARRAETSEAQHPFAIIVGCSDSRTAPELVFDQNLGDLFVVRTAGNLVDDHALGSIEYAVGHGCRLIVVLGHERCGAVGEAMKSASADEHIGSLLRDIQPAVLAAKGRAGDAYANTVKEHARQVAARIRREARFGKAADEVLIISAVYDLDSGRVAKIRG